MKKRLPTIQTLYFLIKPRSKDEDLARKEFILNVLLLGGIFLSIIAIICASISFLYLTRQGKVFHGTSIYTLTLFFLFFLTLYIFSKLGSAKKVSYIFAGIFSFFCDLHILSLGNLCASSSFNFFPFNYYVRDID